MWDIDNMCMYHPEQSCYFSFTTTGHAGCYLFIFKKKHGKHTCSDVHKLHNSIKAIQNCFFFSSKCTL